MLQHIYSLVVSVGLTLNVYRLLKASSHVSISAFCLTATRFPQENSVYEHS